MRLPGSSIMTSGAGDGILALQEDDDEPRTSNLQARAGAAFRRAVAAAASRRPRGAVRGGARLSSRGRRAVLGRGQRVAPPRMPRGSSAEQAEGPVAATPRMLRGARAAPSSDAVRGAGRGTAADATRIVRGAGRGRYVDRPRGKSGLAIRLNHRPSRRWPRAAAVAPLWNIHVAPAAAPRPSPGSSTWHPRRCRDPPTDHPRLEEPAGSRRGHDFAFGAGSRRRVSPDRRRPSCS